VAHDRQGQRLGNMAKVCKKIDKTWENLNRNNTKYVIDCSNRLMSFHFICIVWLCFAHKFHFPNCFFRWVYQVCSALDGTCVVVRYFGGKFNVFFVFEKFAAFCILNVYLHWKFAYFRDFFKDKKPYIRTNSGKEYPHANAWKRTAHWTSRTCNAHAVCSLSYVDLSIHRSRFFESTHLGRTHPCALPRSVDVDLRRDGLTMGLPFPDCPCPRLFRTYHFV